MKTVFWPFCKQFFLQSQALLIGENVDFARLADAAEDMGIQPVAVLSEIHPQTKQLKGNHFSGSCPFFSSRRAVAQTLVMVHVNCDSQELRAGYSEHRLAVSCEEP